MDPDVFQRAELDQYGQESGRGKVAGDLQSQIAVDAYRCSRDLKANSEGARDKAGGSNISTTRIERTQLVEVGREVAVVERDAGFCPLMRERKLDQRRGHGLVRPAVSARELRIQ